MPTLVLNPSNTRRRAIPAVLQIAAAALLGLVMVYATGFSTSAIAHNAAHDGRHSHSFPCH
jgi:cobalt transporter subunit CbtB